MDRCTVTKPHASVTRPHHGPRYARDNHRRRTARNCGAAHRAHESG
ncbi:hypothetical protein [Micromonospora sp. NBRC 101691]|nr:hypothetical protein [Micromonospora sp. NBRC 101691]